MVCGLQNVQLAFINSSFRFLENTTDPGSPDSSGDEITICCPWKGVLIYMLGAFCMALGVNLQKYSINRDQIKHPNESDRKSLWKQPFWVIGLITYGSSGGLLSLALAYAKQSQLAPLMSVVIISNALLARFLLYEPVSYRDMSAIVIIVCAVVLSTTFAPQSENTLKTTQGLIDLYGEPGFMVFIVLLIALLLAFYIGNRYILAKVDPNPPRSSKCLLAMNPYRRKNIEKIESIAGTLNNTIVSLNNKVRKTRASLSGPISAISDTEGEAASPTKRKTKLKSANAAAKRLSKDSGFAYQQDENKEIINLKTNKSALDDEEEDEFVKFVTKRQESFFAFSFGGQAGLWGGLCVTMMKSAISIILDEVRNNSIAGLFTNWLMYVLVAVLICCWTMQLYWISTGLERYPAVFIVSIEAVVNEITAVCGGILYFKEYLEFDKVSAPLFTCGLLFGCLGILIFATRDNYNLEDDFFTCCPINKHYKVDKSIDPRRSILREPPVEEGTRRASFRRQSHDRNSREITSQQDAVKQARELYSVNKAKEADNKLRTTQSLRKTGPNMSNSLSPNTANLDVESGADRSSTVVDIDRNGTETTDETKKETQEKRNLDDEL